VTEASVALLPGDGIGPEVVAVARELVDAVAPDHGLSVSWREHLVGGASIDAHGTALADEVLEACAASDAVLLGAVGGPRWDTTDPGAPRPEQGLLGLRAGLGLYANLRPVRPWPALYDASPLRRERIEGTDLLVVRELTGGLYFGERGREPARAYDTCVYTLGEVERLAEWGFRAAEGRRGKVTSVDKANVLETSRLWREQVTRTAAAHPDVELEHMLVDNAAMQLVNRPADFDVIVTENLFGDILSDEAAMITGSIGLLPSASLGSGTLGLYEPVHGSAPDIAGTGVANPIATCLSAAMMLRYSLGASEAAARIEAAVDAILADGARTRDLGGDLDTAGVSDRLATALR
jgi:3-isopropylmalate dehydrogenase